MINTIIFTKNRPMQVNATLDSMRFYTNFDAIKPIKLLDGSDEPTKLDNPNGIEHIMENEEGGFGQCFKKILSEIPDEEIILFCVDDLVWINFFNPHLLLVLQQYENLVGFSMRLGTNVGGFNTKSESFKTYSHTPVAIAKWGTLGSHWGYPFEVSCSAYRAKLVKQVVESARSLRLPNDLESAGYYYCQANALDKPDYAFLNGTARACCADINRVQDLYQNETKGGEGLTAQNLKKMFDTGRRINWANYFEYVPNEPFMGKDNLEFIN